MIDTPHDRVAHRRTHTADPDTVEVRQAETEEARDGTFRIRLPITSTAEARDGEAFDRAKVEGIRDQIAERTIPLFFDHGRNVQTGHRYSAYGKIGYLANPSLEERNGATDVDADYVIADPSDVDGDVGEIRELLSWLKTQADLGMPITSSLGWSEDTGERDLPGDVDVIEASIVGIPSDLRTTTDTTQAEAGPAMMARAVAAASDGFDAVAFLRELRQAEGVDTVQVPEYDEAANPDGVSWDGLDLEDFEGDVTPQDPVVYNKFIHSATGFPPDEDADFDTLGFEVVDTDGTLLFQALEDAFAVVDQADVTEEEAEAIQEVIVELAASEFPDEDLRAARAEYEVGGETLDITPPEQVVNAAEAARAAQADGVIPDECGTGVGDERAAQIVNDEVGPEVIDEIAAYLTSHEEDVTADGPPTDWSEEEWADCGNAQYAKWGGTNDGTGLSWAQERANAVARAKGEDPPYPEVGDATDTTNDAMSDTTDTETSDESPDDDEREDDMDAQEFRAQMLDLQEQQMETLETVAEAVRQDDEDDEDEGDDEDDDMEEDSADAPDGERTVEIDGEAVPVDEARERLEDLRSQLDDAEPAEPDTRDFVAEDDAETDSDTTDPEGRSALDWRA